jgi:hypothetical protein
MEPIPHGYMRSGHRESTRSSESSGIPVAWARAGELARDQRDRMPCSTPPASSLTPKAQAPVKPQELLRPQLPHQKEPLVDHLPQLGRTASGSVLRRRRRGRGWDGHPHPIRWRPAAPPPFPRSASHAPGWRCRGPSEHARVFVPLTTYDRAMREQPAKAPDRWATHTPEAIASSAELRIPDRRGPASGPPPEPVRGCVIAAPGTRRSPRHTASSRVDVFAGDQPVSRGQAGRRRRSVSFKHPGGVPGLAVLAAAQVGHGEDTSASNH